MLTMSADQSRKKNSQPLLIKIKKITIVNLKSVADVEKLYDYYYIMLLLALVYYI